MQPNTFSTQKCKQFVQKEFMTSALPALVDFIKIQNMSKGFYKQPQWKQKGWDKLMEAAVFVQNWIKNSGVKGATSQIIFDKQKNLTPLIYVQVQGQVDETYLFYGHFDKQPPFVGWNQNLGAYKPVLLPTEQNPQKLYGRGGADDGYSSFGSIIALKALQDQNIPHPRCVMIFQGDEQSSTGDVQKHVENLKQRIGNPKLIFCLDSGCIDYDRMWLTTSLRGFVLANVKVEVVKEGIHSGTYSGIVPNAFRILRLLIEKLQNQETGYMAKQLMVDIPPNRYKEMYDLAKQKGEEAIRSVQTIGNLGRPSNQVLQTLELNTWQPQLAVVGIDGLPHPSVAGNVLLPFVEAKLSTRIPPTKNPEEARDFIVKTLTQNTPYNAKVTVSNVRIGHGFSAPDFPQALQQAVEQASQAYFGKQILYMGEGASIPFMGFLRDLWPTAQFVITGVLGPLSNAHGPNEFLHIPYVKSLICSMAHILSRTIGKL